VGERIRDRKVKRVVPEFVGVRHWISDIPGFEDNEKSVLYEKVNIFELPTPIYGPLNDSADILEIQVLMSMNL